MNAWVKDMRCWVEYSYELYLCFRVEEIVGGETKLLN